ncbi:MAG: LAGLIDADG family homing endonuclease [archaeon]
MKRNVILPSENSEDLAELFGILFGDGCVNFYPSKNDYFMMVSGHGTTDFQYHSDFIKKLFQGLFGLEPNLYLRKDQNCVVSRLRSREVFAFLVNKGIFVGRKTNLTIPPWITNNNSYFTSFVRGLFDTDGSVIIRTRGQHSISLALKNENIILAVKEFLQKKGYFVAYYVNEYYDVRGFHSITHCIRINQRKLIKKYAEEIGSSNPYKRERLMRI